MVVAIAAFYDAAAIGLESRWSLASRAWAESAGQSGAGVRAAMLRMARLLYPHDALSDAVHSGVLDRSLSAVAAGTEFRSQLDQAATALGARAGRPWLELDPAAQLVVMRDIEQCPATGGRHASRLASAGTAVRSVRSGPRCTRKSQVLSRRGTSSCGPAPWPQVPKKRARHSSDSVLADSYSFVIMRLGHHA